MMVVVDDVDCSPTWRLTKISMRKKGTKFYRYDDDDDDNDDKRIFESAEQR